MFRGRRQVLRDGQCCGHCRSRGCGGLLNRDVGDGLRRRLSGPRDGFRQRRRGGGRSGVRGELIQPRRARRGGDRRRCDRSKRGVRDARAGGADHHIRAQRLHRGWCGWDRSREGSVRRARYRRPCEPLSCVKLTQPRINRRGAGLRMFGERTLRRHRQLVGALRGVPGAIELARRGVVSRLFQQPFDGGRKAVRGSRRGHRCSGAAEPPSGRLRLDRVRGERPSRRREQTTGPPAGTDAIEKPPSHVGMMHVGIPPRGGVRTVIP